MLPERNTEKPAACFIVLKLWRTSISPLIWPKMESVIKAVSEFKELWCIVVTTGGSNLNAEFVVKSLEELHDLVYNRLSRIDGVQQVESAIIMKYIKRRYDFGAYI